MRLPSIICWHSSNICLQPVLRQNIKAMSQLPVETALNFQEHQLYKLLACFFGSGSPSFCANPDSLRDTAL